VVAGISLKTQELYLLVFVTRYLDLFTNWSSLYNTAFKVFYLGASAGLVYMLRTSPGLVATYQADRDSFLHLKFGVAPCVVLGLLFSDAPLSEGVGAYLLGAAWAFSLFLEAVAIFPQLVLLTRDREVENITGHYIAALGAYRAFYILNWVWRAATEPGYSAWLVWATGAVQTLLYADFFWHYVKSIQAGAPLGV
jgi:ER lumen protein retaining receptor